jgi:hypothetical protein
MKAIGEILNGVGPRSQYSDTRWISRAASFRSTCGRFCQSCRRADIPISVHHVNYDRGRNLWDYEDQDLAMLCEPCHQLIHKSILAFRRLAGHSNATNIAAITGLLTQLVERHGDKTVAIKLAQLLQ